MKEYVQYFVTWLFFMVLIAGITLIVPKLAKRIDDWRARKKAELKEAEPEKTDQSEPEIVTDDSSEKSEDNKES